MPSNNITIEDDIYIDYAMDKKFPAGISKGRVYGYFNGSVVGLAEDSIPEEYLRVGDLHLDKTSKGDPFQIAVSTKTMNQMFEAIMGENQIEVNVTHKAVKANGFPIEWTSTNLEGAVAGIVDSVGSDKPFSVRFMNIGAPRF